MRTSETFEGFLPPEVPVWPLAHPILSEPEVYRVTYTDRVSLCDAEGREIANVSIFGNNSLDWPEIKRRASELAAAPVMHSALIHALGLILQAAPGERDVVGRLMRAIAAAEGWA